MSLNLVDYQKQAEAATQWFWGNRSSAFAKQQAAGKPDQGNRGKVTAGKNMDGFASLLKDVIQKNGLKDAKIYYQRSDGALPGYFRPSKRWDIVVMARGRLIAAIELKSQADSFGNNFNNRAEEVIGAAKDIWTAYRELSFGRQPKFFLGWLMMIADTPKSRKLVRLDRSHYPPEKLFENTSYISRYEILCQRLMTEKLYDAAALITSTPDSEKTGRFGSASDMTSLRTFIARLAGHVAAEAAANAKP